VHAGKRTHVIMFVRANVRHTWNKVVLWWAPVHYESFHSHSRLHSSFDRDRTRNVYACCSTRASE